MSCSESLPPTEEPLDVVNKLHQVLAAAGLHADLGLPQIAVVGSQSVGKTSVLQSLVGRDFLPRGTGIVTRRPLVLQLRTTAKVCEPELQGTSGGAVSSSAPPPSLPGGDEGNIDEWAEFTHKIGEHITDFELVSREISAETERVCGCNQVVSKEPILLRIFSPAVMDLTLVDLPGLTKVPTGDQPPDISQQIKKLVLQYIRPKSCLILAVSASNADLATSDALALAREVDPHGERTLGVLTKLDLADESTGAFEALQGRHYPLKLGYVGVVCRSENASRAGVTFEEAIKVEEKFLSESKIFRHVAKQCGIPHLARRLQQVLLQHVREALPDLRSRLQAMADSHRQELATFGDLGKDASLEQGAFLLRVISGYVRNFADALEGRLAYSQREAPSDKVVGGARLHYIFHRIFARAVLDFDAFNGLSDLEIRVAMRNAAGPKPQLFVPEVAFEALVKRQISKLQEPALQCVNLVYEELKHLASQSEVPEMQSYPALRDRVLEVAQRVIRRCLQPTNKTVSNLVELELAHINVDHPDFIGGVNAMSRVQASAMAVQEDKIQGLQRQQVAPDDVENFREVPLGDDTVGAQHIVASPRDPVRSEGLSGNAGSGLGGPGSFRNRWGEVIRGSAEDQLRLPAVPLVVTPSGQPSEKERMDTALLKSLVSSYYAIVQRKVIDAVPKTIMHFMVNSVRDALHHECIAELYKAESFTTLLTEAEDARQRRVQCERKLEELRRAQDLVAQIRDTAF